MDGLYKIDIEVKPDPCDESQLETEQSEEEYVADLAHAIRFLNQHEMKADPPVEGRNGLLAEPRPRRGKQPRAGSREALSLSAHAARCTVCRHPERDEIEDEFLHWGSPWNMARDYEVSRRAIYRHAHALNLYAVRDRNIRYALGYLIEEVDRVKPTAESIVRAVHAFARLNNKGEWVEPASHVIVSSGSRNVSRERPGRPERRFNVIGQAALAESNGGEAFKSADPPLEAATACEHDSGSDG